jgi:hypothetical protein
LLLVDRLANFHMQAQMPNHIWYFFILFLLENNLFFI